jgi:putative transposase
MLPKRPRIHGFPYSGLHRYSLTICTKLRKPLFAEADVVGAVLFTLRQCAALHQFAILAYCFMPDHVHLVVSAITEDADLRMFISKWKQLAGYAYKQKTGEFLWQPSYYDHVLRDDEETSTAVRYLLENPVRKGLVKHFEDYMFSGSDVFNIDELRGFWEPCERHRQG